MSVSAPQSLRSAGAARRQGREALLVLAGSTALCVLLTLACLLILGHGRQV